MTEETQALLDRHANLRGDDTGPLLDDMAAALSTLSRDLAAARACPDCQQPLACPAGTAERIAGLEAMHEETLTRAERAEADLAAARQERNEAQSNYDGACRTIALMHEAATGRSGEGPHLGVVEDVAAAVRAARAETETAIRAALVTELRAIASWLGQPGNVWKEDAVDECRRVLTNRARVLEHEAAPLPAAREGQ